MQPGLLPCCPSAEQLTACAFGSQVVHLFISQQKGRIFSISLVKRTWSGSDSGECRWKKMHVAMERRRLISFLIKEIKRQLSHCFLQFSPPRSQGTPMSRCAGANKVLLCAKIPAYYYLSCHGCAEWRCFYQSKHTQSSGTEWSISCLEGNILAWISFETCTITLFYFTFPQDYLTSKACLWSNNLESDFALDQLLKAHTAFWFINFQLKNVSD